LVSGRQKAAASACAMRRSSAAGQHGADREADGIAAQVHLGAEAAA
jgi:hypothetical protein